MNQILLGVLAVLLLGLGIQTYRLDTASTEVTVAQTKASLLQGQLDQQAEWARDQEGRFVSLDSKLVALDTVIRENGLLLAGKLDSLDKIQKQPEDTDETINCATLPVPADVDRILRQ